MALHASSGAAFVLAAAAACSCGAAEPAPSSGSTGAVEATGAVTPSAPGDGSTAATGGPPGSTGSTTAAETDGAPTDDASTSTGGADDLGWGGTATVEIDASVLAQWRSLPGPVAIQDATSLAWSMDATCFPNTSWAPALQRAQAFAPGEDVCAPEDGSSRGGWHLPNIAELAAIGDVAAANPALAATSPVAVANRALWSSTSFAANPTRAWAWFPYDGHVEPIQKSEGYIRTMLFARDATDAELPEITVGGVASVDEIGELRLTGIEALPAVLRTGQTSCWDGGGQSIACDGSGHDGELQRGYAGGAPRFELAEDGTARDRWTGRTWLISPGCAGPSTFAEASARASGVGDPDCGLRDGSRPGEWALPQPADALRIMHFEREPPVLAEGVVPDVALDRHWTAASAHLDHGVMAWIYNPRNAVVTIDPPNLEGGAILIRAAPASAISCALEQRLSAREAIVACAGRGRRVRARLDLDAEGK